MQRISVLIAAFGAWLGTTGCQDEGPPCRASAVYAGFVTTWVVTDSGDVWAWGPLNGPAAKYVPSKMTAVTADTVLSARGDMICARSPSGALRCGRGGDAFAQEPVAEGVREFANSVSNGGGGDSSQQGCILKEGGSVGCWNLARVATLRPGDVTDLPTIGNESVALAVAVEQKCALKGDGSVWCWGAGFLGDGHERYADDFKLGPTQVVLPGPAAAIAAGRFASCAMLTDGTVYCWGELRAAPSTGREGFTLSPEKVPLAGATSITMGGLHACAILKDNTLWCWGSNKLGQLGRAPSSGFQEWESPTEVTALGADVTMVSAGFDHTCARRADATIWCWGRSDYGQAGTLALENGSPLLIRGCQ